MGWAFGQGDDDPGKAPQAQAGSEHEAQRGGRAAEGCGLGPGTLWSLAGRDPAQRHCDWLSRGLGGPGARAGVDVSEAHRKGWWVRVASGDIPDWCSQGYRQGLL